LNVISIDVVADAIEAAQTAGTFIWHDDDELPPDTRRFSGIIIDGQPVTVQSISDDNFIVIP